MAEASHSPQPIRFGVFELDLRAGELRKKGIRVKLQEQPFQILVMLLERPGQVVTREELHQKLWPEGTFVDFEHGLNAAVNRLRDALEDSPENSRFVETLPRRGYRFIAPVEGLEQAVAVSRLRIPPVWIGALAVVALATVLVGLNVGGLRDWLQSGTAPGEITSLAVLPLKNLSGDPEQEYFVDGMTEALITELGKISALRVISRQSVMQFKDTNKSLPEIASELNVDAVVEGSALREGDQVRISAQLIQAVPEQHLWAESYERELSDVLALQREIARAIAREISIAVTPTEEIRLASARAVNPDAHEAYLTGRYHLYKWDEEGVSKAIEYSQQAIDIDPTYAPAYALLSEAYNQAGFHAYRDPEEAYPRAKAAALTALELDQTLAAAHSALGLVRFCEWDWLGAEREYQRALELNPNSVDALGNYSYYLTSMGRFQEGITAINHAVELDPLTPSNSLQLGWTYFIARRYDESIDEYNKTIAQSPDLERARHMIAVNYAKKGMYAEAVSECERVPAPSHAPYLLANLGWVYGVSGRRAEALKSLDRLKELSGRRRIDPSVYAMIYAGLAEKDRAFHWLNKAYELRSCWLHGLKAFPTYDPLRDDPRFQSLLRRMNFPE